MSLKFIYCHLTGDPLYVAGGQPKCLGSDFVDESFADDGYGYTITDKPFSGFLFPVVFFLLCNYCRMVDLKVIRK